MNAIIKKILELNAQGIHVEFQDTQEPEIIRLCFSEFSNGLKRMPLEILVHELNSLVIGFDEGFVMMIDLAMKKFNEKK